MILEINDGIDGFRDTYLIRHRQIKSNLNKNFGHKETDKNDKDKLSTNFILVHLFLCYIRSRFQ